MSSNCLTSESFKFIALRLLNWADEAPKSSPRYADEALMVILRNIHVRSSFLLTDLYYNFSISSISKSTYAPDRFHFPISVHSFEPLTLTCLLFLQLRLINLSLLVSTVSNFTVPTNHSLTLNIAFPIQEYVFHHS